MKVLIVGYRREIARTLESRGVDFAIWNDVALKNKTRAKRVIVEDYPKDAEAALKQLRGLKPFTHVIAGKESSVYPASLLRKWLGAARNPHTVIQRCHDKLLMKKYLKGFGIPMTEFMEVFSPEEMNQALEKLGGEVIAKERTNSGGRGIAKLQAGKGPLRFPRQGLILEKEIKGSEGSIESFILDKEICFQNVTEYRVIREVNWLPGKFDPDFLQEILELNRKVIQAMHIKWGMTHLEFYRTEKGILFGEIALRPPGGHIMDALKLSYGFDPWEAFVSVELQQEFPFPELALQSSAAIVLHPGAGTVKKIEGVQKVLALPSLQRFRLKVKSGSKIKARVGSGDDVGYALMAHPDPQVLESDYLTFRNELQFVLQ